jgi:hypothetical protein
MRAQRRGILPGPVKGTDPLGEGRQKVLILLDIASVATRQHRSARPKTLASGDSGIGGGAAVRADIPVTSLAAISTLL